MNLADFLPSLLSALSNVMRRFYSCSLPFCFDPFRSVLCRAASVPRRRSPPISAAYRFAVNVSKSRRFVQVVRIVSNKEHWQAGQNRPLPLGCNKPTFAASSTTREHVPTLASHADESDRARHAGPSIVLDRPVCAETQRRFLAKTRENLGGPSGGNWRFPVRETRPVLFVPT